MKKVLLINQGKSNENLGDKAIAEIFQKVLIENECLVELAGFSQTKVVSMSNIDVNSRNSNREKLRSKLKKYIPSFFVWLLKYKAMIKKEFDDVTKNNTYDIVIIGGGQLLKSKSVFVYALLSWYQLLRKNLKCPIVIAGVGADTNFSKLETIIYKYILTKVDDIYVRDLRSINILKDKFNVDAKYFPDIVLYDLNIKDVDVSKYTRNKLLVSVFAYNSYVNNVGIGISKLEYYRLWLNLINENMEENLEIILGYTAIGDKKETLDFANYLKENTSFNFIIVNNDELPHYIETLKNTKKMISGRMHGMLLGLNYGCEVIPFVVSPKVETFKREWIDSNIDVEKIRNDIRQSINNILKLSI
ncbi:polysaccharide pyruvyl transferase family protein [Sporosarcina sp. CAU 1771]